MKYSKKTIGALLDWRAAETPDNLAIEYWDKNYTWGEVGRLSDYLAVRFRNAGIKKGDHVGIWSVNTPNWLLTFFALEKLGAVPVLINTCYKEAELLQTVNYADVKALCYGDGYKSERYQPIVAVLRKNEKCKVEKWIHIGRSAENSWMSDGSFSEQEKSSEAIAAVHKELESVDCQDTAAMLFTSGTTSFSKGVMLSHYNLVNSALGTLEFTQWAKEDKQMVSVPLFHCFGITSCLLTSVHVGNSLHIVKYFKTQATMEQIEQSKCTVLNGVPSMFLAMSRKNQGQYSLASLKSGIIAGSPVSQKEYEEIQAMVPQMALLPSYGQTESSPCVTLMLTSDPYEKRSTSAGRLITDEELRCTDIQTGEVLPEGETGEIEIRGYNVMKGYYNMPKETAETISSDGWLKSGDLGYMDADGYLHIVGRKKEMIIRCGENISPKEIEDVIREIPEISEVKVIGIPAEVVQERIVACIVMRPGTARSKEEILLYLKPRLAHYKLPSEILWFEALPMNASGKVKISELKQLVIDRLSNSAINNTDK